MQEVELKFLKINPKEIETQLKKLGAIKKYDLKIKSHSFENKEFSATDSSQKYLRVRQIGNQVFLTYKDPALKNSEATSRKEIEILVSDYNNTLELLHSLGFKKTVKFSKHRVHYEFNNIHFDIDKVPGIQPYLEIETTNMKDMKLICKSLNLDYTKGRKGTIFEIYPNKKLVN